MCTRVSVFVWNYFVETPNHLTTETSHNVKMKERGVGVGGWGGDGWGWMEGKAWMPFEGWKWKKRFTVDLQCGISCVFLTLLCNYSQKVAPSIVECQPSHLQRGCGVIQRNSVSVRRTCRRVEHDDILISKPPADWGVWQRGRVECLKHHAFSFHCTESFW